MHDVLVAHPIDDPELVSYVRPELRAMQPEIEKVNDCYSLLRTDKCKSKYLAQEPGEPDEAYLSRLNRSTYTSTFRDAIRAFAGLLGNYQTHDFPKTLEENLENVDMMGSSLSKFLNDLDQAVLRDGGAGVLVEMPNEQENLGSALEETEEGRRPYLLRIDRSNLINWRTEMHGGREVVVHAVVRTVMELPMEGGRFGTKMEPIYVHLFPGGFIKYKLERGGNGAAHKWQMVKIAEGATSLPIVPIVWMGSTQSRMGSSMLPLIGLANLSLQHFQLRSDLSELLHKLSMPVPVRRGAPTDAHGRPAPLMIGPNTAIDLPVEGGFEFAEPSGGSLQQHQQEIIHVEALMDRSSLAFMYGSESGGRTATEAMLQSSQIQAQIATLIENKESAVDMIVRLWSSYTGEKVAQETGIEVSDNLIQRPLEAQEVQSLLNLYGENAISHQTLLEELQRGHALSQDIDIEEEIARIDEEKTKAQEEAMAQMEAMSAFSDDPAEEAPSAGKFTPNTKDQDPKKEQEAKAGKKPVKGAAAAAKVVAKNK